MTSVVSGMGVAAVRMVAAGVDRVEEEEEEGGGGG